MNGFYGNDSVKARVLEWASKDCFPHALLVVAPAGCGRNVFASHLASLYLNDTQNKVLRGIHPDCLTLLGEGASGNIPVAQVRELLYELHRTAVTADGKRTAILRDVKDLNKNSANALLKILEEPPPGVLLLLTASSPFDILETLRSRCAVLTLLPLTVRQCVDVLALSYPAHDRAFLQSLSVLYGGRVGLVKRILDSPERLALHHAAGRFCQFSIKKDTLNALLELSTASSRNDMLTFLQNSVCFLHQALLQNTSDTNSVLHVSELVSAAIKSLECYAPPSLVSARLTAQL